MPLPFLCCSSQITVIGMCTREVVVNKAQTCTEMEKKEECQMVEKIREVACEAPSVRSIDSECDNGEEEEVCVDVNKTVTKKGIRYETKLETFPCTSTYAKEVCVEVVNLVDSTCSATLSETSEVPCTRKHKKQVCQDKDVPSVEVCTDISEQEIQYACDQLTFEEVRHFPGWTLYVLHHSIVTSSSGILYILLAVPFVSITYTYTPFPLSTPLGFFLCILLPAFSPSEMHHCASVRAGRVRGHNSRDHTTAMRDDLPSDRVHSPGCPPDGHML